MNMQLPETDWAQFIAALPCVVTQLDRELRVVHQFNAPEPLHAQPGTLFWQHASDECAKLKDWLQQILDSRESDTLELSLKVPGGRVIWYEHRVGVLPDQQGLVIVSNDITERKQAETASAQESQFLRQLLESIDAGVLVYNFDLEQTIYVNQFVEDLHGKPVSATPDHHYLNDTHPDDYERVIQYGRTVLPYLADDEVSTIEYRIIDGRGQVRWVLVHDRALTWGDDGRVIVNLGIMVDITERKALEAEMAQLSRRFQALFNNTSDGIMISSFGTSYDDARLLAANQRAATIAGYPLDELYHLRPSDILPVDELEVAENRVKQLASGDEAARVVERRGKRKDGTIFFVESLGIYIDDEKGNITEMMTLVRDITERKQREQELIEARITAETALKARDVFIANMSHELRNPLNTIQGFAQLLLERPDLPPGSTEDLQAIDASAEHLTRLITDVLDLSRVEAGFDKLHPVACAVRDVFERLEKVVRLQARRKGLELYFEIADNLPEQIQLDEVKLKHG